MTSQEFTLGYFLLVTQPWGRRYEGKTPIAQVQADLYFKRFSIVNPFVWQGVCELYAEGDHWPSIDELKIAIRENSREASRPAELEGPLPLESDLIAQLFRYYRTHDVSVYGAAVDFIPPWMAAHPHEPDYEWADRLLTQAQAAIAAAPSARRGGGVKVKDVLPEMQYQQETPPE